MLKALAVRGPFLGPGGYDHHVREFARELHRQGVAVELVDLPAFRWTCLPPALRDPWFESLRQPTGAGVVLHFCLPHRVVPDPDRFNVNHTMFEATRIPEPWARHSRRHDLVLLPTESSRQAWIRGGVSAERLRLCPLGIDPAIFSRPCAPLPLAFPDGAPVARYRTRFLNVSEFGPRKNLTGLLRAWIRATSRDDDAVLVMKVGTYAGGMRERFAVQRFLLEKALGKRLADAAPVLFVYDVFADRDMPRLYRAATHYISMSFGEGWDQTMVEAAASGLALIAPAHSAYTTYLDASVADLVPCREVPAAYDGDRATAAFFEGASWWEPDEAAAVVAIRAAIAGRDTRTASARERILADFTWESATQRLIAILGELEAR